MGKIKQSVQLRLLLSAILPMFISMVIVSNVSNTLLKRNMIRETESQLKSVTYATLNSLSNDLDGRISTNSSGDMVLGDKKIEGNNNIVDNIKKQTEIDITIFQNDTRITTSIINSDNQRVVGTKASDTVIDTVLNKGNNYFSKNINIEGSNYFGYYIPLYNKSGDIIGMVFAGKESTNFYSLLNISIVMITTITIAAIAISILINIITSRKISKALIATSENLKKMSEGDLTVSLDDKFIKRQDEIGIIANQSQKLQESLINLISEASNASSALHNDSKILDDSARNCLENSNSVNSAMNEISNGAVSQANNTQNASEKTITIGNLIKDISDHVTILDKNSYEIQHSEKEANKIIADSQSYNDITIEAVEKIKNQADKTDDSAKKIKNTTKLITDIAEQTNLLSLNASIEAARAGEAGKGFAVVAEEIQKLAEESNKSAKIIEETISELLKDSSSTVLIIKDVQEAVNNQKTKIHETKDKFSTVSAGISKTIDSIHTINSKNLELTALKNEIIDIIENLSAISEENAASTEETTATMNELSNVIANISNLSANLNSLSDQLHSSISTFKLA